MKKLMPKRSELVILAVIVLVLACWLLLPKSSGGSVTVTVNGEQQGTYSLLQDRRVEISGYAGYTLELVIEGGCAHVENATCPDLICQNHTKVSKSGSQIICLPARTVIEVERESTEEEEELPDVVVG